MIFIIYIFIYIYIVHKKICQLLCCSDQDDRQRGHDVHGGQEGLQQQQQAHPVATASPTISMVFAMHHLPLDATHAQKALGEEHPIQAASTR